MAVNPDGTLAFVTGGLFTYVTVAYRADTGHVVWRAEYTAGAGVGDYLAVSADGTMVFIFGSQSSGGFVTVAYDARTGRQLWRSLYEPPGGGGVPLSIAASSAGGAVYGTGYSYNPGTNYDVTTIGYDAETGEMLWVATYDGPAHDDDIGWSIAVSPDGSRVFVAGNSPGADVYDEDAVTLAYDASTGAQLWASRYDGAHQYDVAASVAVSPDGTQVFAVGNTEVDFKQYFLTIAYDASTGRQDWVSVYGRAGSSSGEADDVQSSPDGRLAFVTGGSGGNGLRSDVDTIAYDTGTGTQVWAAHFSRTSIINTGVSLGVDPDGTAVYVAAVTSWSQYDYLTLSYQADTGVLRWASDYGGFRYGDDTPASLAVSPTSGPGGPLVFVTGISEEPHDGFDMATVAYEGGTGLQPGR